MLTQPYAVDQIYTTTAPGGVIEQTLIPVQKPNWKRFCMESDANNFLKVMQTVAPGATMAVQEGLLEESLMYVFTYTDPTVSPRVWMVNGALANGDTIGEYAGWLMDRQTCPLPFVDNTSGNPKENTLQYTDEFGTVEFFWGAGAAGLKAVNPHKKAVKKA